MTFTQTFKCDINNPGYHLIIVLNINATINIYNLRFAIDISVCPHSLN